MVKKNAIKPFGIWKVNRNGLLLCVSIELKEFDKLVATVSYSFSSLPLSYSLLFCIVRPFVAAAKCYISSICICLKYLNKYCRCLLLAMAKCTKQINKNNTTRHRTITSNGKFGKRLLKCNKKQIILVFREENRKCAVGLGKMHIFCSIGIFILSNP